jgi:hypothetical protein
VLIDSQFTMVSAIRRTCSKEKPQIQAILVKWHVYNVPNLIQSYSYCLVGSSNLRGSKPEHLLHSGGGNGRLRRVHTELD